MNDPKMIPLSHAIEALHQGLLVSGAMEDATIKYLTFRLRRELAVALGQPSSEAYWDTQIASMSAPDSGSQPEDPFDYQVRVQSSPIIRAWQERVNAAMEAMKTAPAVRVIFSTTLQERSEENRVYHEHHGQQVAEFLFPVTHSLGEHRIDEEALPYYPICFGDGCDILADTNELFSADPRFLEMVTAVSGGIAMARALGYVGPWHLADEGTPAEHAAFLSWCQSKQSITVAELFNPNAHNIPKEFKASLEAAYREVIVAAIPLLDKEVLESPDRSASGTYAVMVPDGLSEANTAAVALDGFHANVSVRTVDDFAFVVIDPQTGYVLEEEAAPRAFALETLCGLFRRVGDELPRIYSVDVMAVGKDNAVTALGTVTLSSSGEEEASRQAVAALWDSKLDSMGCSIRYDIRRLH